MGSLFVTRPTLMTYAIQPSDLLRMAEAMFAVVISGKVKVEVSQQDSFHAAARARADLEGRNTTGSTLLLT